MKGVCLLERASNEMKRAKFLENATSQRTGIISKKQETKTGFSIRSKHLRVWFADNMGRLSFPDRYIDPLCGKFLSPFSEAIIPTLVLTS